MQQLVEAHVSADDTAQTHPVQSNLDSKIDHSLAVIEKLALKISSIHSSSKQQISTSLHTCDP